MVFISRAAPFPDANRISFLNRSDFLDYADTKPAVREFLTGAAADKKVQEIVAGIRWEPEAAMRSPYYSSLAERLKGKTKFHPDLPEQSNEITPVATYGNIIIVVDKAELASRELLLSDTRRCFQELEKVTAGRATLDASLKDKTPLIMRVSHNENESIVSEFSGAYDCSFYHDIDSETKKVKHHAYIHNYDEIVFYPRRTKLLSNGTLEPPWLIMGHEFKHREQYSRQRELSLQHPGFDSIKEPFGNPYGVNFDLDADALDHNLHSLPSGNGIYDVEDGAAAYERTLAEEARLPKGSAPHIYGKKGRAATVFVDDPVHPKKITRAILNDERENYVKP